MQLKIFRKIMTFTSRRLSFDKLFATCSRLLIAISRIFSEKYYYQRIKKVLWLKKFAKLTGASEKKHGLTRLIVFMRYLVNSRGISIQGEVRNVEI